MVAHNTPLSSVLLLENQLLTVEHLSKFLSVSELTIRDWVYKRKIPFRKLGHLVRFDPLDIRKWLNERGRDAN